MDTNEGSCLPGLCTFPTSSGATIRSVWPAKRPHYPGIDRFHQRLWDRVPDPQQPGNGGLHQDSAPMASLTKSGTTRCRGGFFGLFPGTTLFYCHSQLD